MAKKTPREKRRSDRRNQNPATQTGRDGKERRSKTDRRKMEPAGGDDNQEIKIVNQTRKEKLLERRIKDKDLTMRRKNQRFVKENIYQ